MKESYTSRSISIAIIFLIYLIAFLAVYFIYPLLPFENTMIKVLSVDVLATVIVFIFSILFKNSSVYDPYWSVIPPFIVVYVMNLYPGGNDIRQIIILLLVLFWSLRLTLNWLRGWQGFSHEDWRYISIAKQTGKFYWPVSFLGIHLMPTLFVFFGCLPLWYSLSSESAFNISDLLATIFTFVAILIEWIADEQMIRFRKNNATSQFINSGLWAVSRHPNYLGEISFWIGMFLFVLSVSGFKANHGLWTGVGFVFMVLLFVFISIPLMEKRNLVRKPGYADYIKSVPALIPWRIRKN